MRFVGLLHHEVAGFGPPFLVHFGNWVGFFLVEIVHYGHPWRFLVLLHEEVNAAASSLLLGQEII